MPMSAKSARIAQPTVPIPSRPITRHAKSVKNTPCATPPAAASAIAARSIPLLSRLKKLMVCSASEVLRKRSEQRLQRLIVHFELHLHVGLLDRDVHVLE